MHICSVSLMLAHLRADAEGTVQVTAVLAHTQREVSVALIHRAHPFLQLGHVYVAFLHKVVSQLNQQFHLFLRLLGDRTCSKRVCSLFDKGYI